MRTREGDAGVQAVGLGAKENGAATGYVSSAPPSARELHISTFFRRPFLT